ncbi:hypothetical protein JVU11DRAFT_11739 [Chiua virens]|nr:hypothetical protein JVU11DRAFT_11739 [Chiua virens]
MTKQIVRVALSAHLHAQPHLFKSGSPAQDVFAVRILHFRHSASHSNAVTLRKIRWIDLSQQLSNTRINDPDEVTVPPTLGTYYSLRVEDDSKLRGTTSSHTQVENTLMADVLTYRNICRQEYMEQNQGKSVSQFDNYRRKLPGEQKKISTDKFEALKAKTQAKGKGKATNVGVDDEALDDNGT